MKSNLLKKVNDLSNSFSHDIFSRGFLLCENEPRYIPSHWRRTEFKGLNLYFDPRVEIVAKSIGNDVHITCLGIIVDLRFPVQSNSEIIMRLANDLKQGEDIFYDSLSWTNGRYIILYDIQGEGIRILNDATGMRCVFYDEGSSKTVASHAALLALNLTEKADSKFSIPHRFGFPGRLTPYKGVFMLTPNTYLNLSNKKIKRFYPTTEITQCEVEDIREECSKLITRAGEAFASRYPLIMSLTAGLDSRFILSCLRNFRYDIDFFTYYREKRNKTELIDVFIAHKLSQAFRLKHKIVNLSQVEVSERFVELSKLNAHYHHIRSLSRYYYDQYNNTDTVHVRSNLSEIGRAFYGRILNPIPTLDENALVKMYTTPYLIANLENETIKQFYFEAKKDFIEITELKKGAEFLDYRDLFYWEHRMGTWHSQVVAESDVGFETVSLFNSRRILECLLSPPFKDRQENKLYNSIIGYNWPELRNIPVNPKHITEEEEDFVEVMVKRKDLNLEEISNVVQSIDEKVDMIVEKVSALESIQFESIKNLKNENLFLKRQIKEIKQSRSWRITSPLRGITTYFKRKK